MFHYYNRNPNNIVIEDCVCRAISVVTGLKYETVEALLELTAQSYDCEKLCVSCYHNLLEDILFMDPIYCYNGETVEDISQLHCDKKVLIRINGHLTASIYGEVLDTWDCTNEFVDCYWLV